MDEEYSNVTMVDQIAIAVSSPKNYKHLTTLSAGKTVAFVILMTFVLTFIQFGIGVVTFLMHVGGLKHLLSDTVPQFEVKNGELVAETEMSLDIGTTTIYINTDYDEISLADLSGDGVYIAFGKKNIVMGVISGTQTAEYSNMKISDLFEDGFHNEMLASATPAIYVALVLIYVFTMVGDAVEWLFFALVYSIVANALAKNARTGLSYANVLRVCIYGQTTGLLLTAANNCLGYLLSSSIMFLIMVFLSFVMISRGITSHMTEST